MWVAKSAAAVVIAGSALVLTGLDDDRGHAPVEPPNPTPKPATAPNGGVAVDAYQGGGDIYLARPGDDLYGQHSYFAPIRALAIYRIRLTL